MASSSQCPSETDFSKLTSNELKSYLRRRCVPVQKECHRELAEKAFLASKLCLPVRQTEEEAQESVNQAKQAKLVFDEGITRLPRPESLRDGWEDGPVSLPDTNRGLIESYIKAGNRRIGLLKTEGRRTLSLGKILYMSKHVHDLQYHGINANISYCFVRGKVTPQQKLSERPYNCWVVIKKETGQFLSAECSCIVGVQATCKHIAGLMFAIVEAVEEGRNISSTSQRQTWGQGGNKRGLNLPKFATNIAVMKVRDNVERQDVHPRFYRSEFEPRPVAIRDTRALSQFNLDSLANATNGDCAILTNFIRETDPFRQEPNLADVESTEEIETSIPPLTVDKACSELIRCGIKITPDAMINSLAVSLHQQTVVSIETKNQAQSTAWHQHRHGHITASIAGECANAVSKDGKVQGHSHIARIFNYYGKFLSPATEWGKTMENIAIKQYLAQHRLKKHHSVSVEKVGLFISETHPYIAASPDGMVHCKECGQGLVEVKNPYSHRKSEISHLLLDKNSCLEKVNGVVQLKRKHPYYVQLQTQMWITKCMWCDFVVRTDSKFNNIFVERINIDMEFFKEVLQKLEVFFEKGIIPELKSREIQSIVRVRVVQKILEDMVQRVANSLFVKEHYPCGTCQQPCETVPDSICCDECEQRFHFQCVGLISSQKFFRKRKCCWKCQDCNQRRRVKHNSEP